MENKVCFNVYLNDVLCVPFIDTLDERVSEVSSSFTRITGYTNDDIGGQYISQVFSLLRMMPEFGQSVNEEGSCHFIFTKYFEAKSVSISSISIDTGKKAYIFTERPEQGVEGKFPMVEQFCRDNVSGIAIYSVPEFVLLKVNDKYLDIFDEPCNKKEYSLGRKICELIPEWSGSSMEKVFNSVVENGRTCYFNEYMYDMGKRSVTYWDVSLTPIFSNREIKFLISSIIEVTDRVLYRRQLEEQARIIEQQKRQLEAIIDNVSDGLIVVDRHYNMKLLNREARDHFYMPGNVFKSGDTFWHTRYYDEEGNRISLENMPGLRILKGEEIRSERMKVVCPDKTLCLSISGSPVYDESGDVSMAIMCTRDVTDRVENESILRSQRDFMYSIIDTLDLPIIRLSYPCMDIIELNHKACEYIRDFSSCSEMDIVSIKRQSMYELFPLFNSDKIRKLLYQMAETRSIVYLNEAVLNAEGRKVYGRFIFQPLTDTSGEIIEVLTVFIDLTNEIEKNKTLEKLLKTQEEFFSFISHEFKTPITVTSTAIQAMKYICGSELSERAKGFIEQINRSTLQQLCLVNNLLDIARSDAGYLKINKRNLDIISITKSLIDSVTLYAKGKGVNIMFSSSLSQKIVALDDEKYERVILNLLSNAIKFTPQGKNIYVSLYMRRNRISIEVKDEGIGIPRDKQKTIFERFKQSENGLARNTQGTGIGLCLVKMLVKAMGGRITLGSKEGCGSTFTILLPDMLIDNKDRFLQTALEDRMAQTVKIEFSTVNAN